MVALCFLRETFSGLSVVFLFLETRLGEPDILPVFIGARWRRGQIVLLVLKVAVLQAKVKALCEEQQEDLMRA